MKEDSGLSNPNAMNSDEYAWTLLDQNVDFESLIDSNSVHQSTRLPDSEGDLNKGSDFNDLVVLKYINQMLMEEDIDEKNCIFQESAALQAAEKSFYNALTVKDQDDHGEVHSQDEESIGFFGVNMSSTIGKVDLTCDITESSLLPNPLMTSFDSLFRFHHPYSYSLFSSSSFNNNMFEGFLDSPVSILSFPDMFCDNRSAVRFAQIGIDDIEASHNNGEGHIMIPGGKRNLDYNPKDDVENLRINSKQSAVYSEPAVSSKLFDDVLLCGGPKTHPFQCDFVCKDTAYYNKLGHQADHQTKARSGTRKRKEVVDVNKLLILCAESVSINDQRGVTELLKRIREHALPNGDGMQRLAHYFSAGLEARMAGSGTGIYKSLLSPPASAPVDVLKAYRLFLGCFPFTKISHFVSNKTIMSVAQNKTKLHIIDFGILHGFQWPCLIQRLSTRPGGPPELRITGIDFPCPGFRPTQQVEETGRRLAGYAETFGVVFKFKAIAQNWETIRIEDLELDDDETLVVNCGYRFRNLLDESVIVESPRSKVLDLIRKMNPEIFIHGIVNGSYGVPFFLTRFREALFFFSSLFDMLDATVDHLTTERMLIEKTMWGREAMNVIACEDGERIERPETYKQWQVRNQRAGFRQVAFDQKILKMAKDRGASDYHQDFLIDEDGYWMLQGWKGRVLYAISAWKPAC